MCIYSVIRILRIKREEHQSGSMEARFHEFRLRKNCVASLQSKHKLQRHCHSVVRNRIVAIVEMVHPDKFILVRIFRFQAGRAVMASFYSGVKVA